MIEKNLLNRYEEDCLKLIKAKKSLLEMAEILHLSPRTVNFCIGNLRAKLKQTALNNL
jgi:DNA-binding CsgD family transcriptional regulator